jgi:hypothetical protein
MPKLFFGCWQSVAEKGECASLLVYIYDDKTNKVCGQLVMHKLALSRKRKANCNCIDSTSVHRRLRLDNCKRRNVNI